MFGGRNWQILSLKSSETNKTRQHAFAIVSIVDLLVPLSAKRKLPFAVTTLNWLKLKSLKRSVHWIRQLQRASSTRTTPRAENPA